MRCLIALLFVVLTGCLNLAPDYQRPASPVPNEWPQGAAYTLNPTDAANASIDDDNWRAFILDPSLRQLIELALEHNRDLRVASLNIEKAQAQYRINRALLFPTITATANETGMLTPAELSSTGVQKSVHDYSASLGFSNYELDFFGHLRNLKAAAFEQYLGTQAAQRSVRLSLIAQLASAYFNRIANQAHLALAQKTLDEQTTAYTLNRRRFELGIASELDLNQAQTTLEIARGDMARYTSLAAQDFNALTLLVGTTIPDHRLPGTSPASSAILSDAFAGLPSDLLIHRPDILEAEHQLKAANANIGVARAAFFPSITLTTSIGTASTQLSGLFKPGSRTWGFMPQIELPIFDAGSRFAGLDAAHADQKIAVAQYEKAIQTAFREVADALADRGTLGAQLNAQQGLVNATTRSYELSKARYERGIDSYLAVLDSSLQRYNAEHGLINVELARQNNAVTLYKALGGWFQVTDVGGQ